MKTLTELESIMNDLINSNILDQEVLNGILQLWDHYPKDMTSLPRGLTN